MDASFLLGSMVSSNDPREIPHSRTMRPSLVFISPTHPLRVFFYCLTEDHPLLSPPSLPNSSAPLVGLGLKLSKVHGGPRGGDQTMITDVVNGGGAQAAGLFVGDR